MYVNAKNLDRVIMKLWEEKKKTSTHKKNGKKRIVQIIFQLPRWFDFAMPRPVLSVLGSTKHVLLYRIAGNGIPVKETWHATWCLYCLFQFKHFTFTSVHKLGLWQIKGEHILPLFPNSQKRNMINGKVLAQQYHLQHQSMKKVITLRYNRAEQYDKQAGSRSLNA